MIFHLDKQYLYGKEDVNLFKKLTTSEELSGLLNIALVGLSRLVKEGGFHDRTIDDIRRTTTFIRMMLTPFYMKNALSI